MKYPDPPPFAPDPVPPPPRRKNGLIIAVGVITVAATLGLGFLIGSASDDDPAPKAPRTTSAPATVEDDDGEPLIEEEEPTPEYEEYGPTDFLIELKTTSKDCFGSAGCLVTVEPELTFMWETGDIDPDATYSITYEITGDEDGPVIDTLTLTNQSDISYNKKNLSTTSSDTEIDVEITDVSVY